MRPKPVVSLQYWKEIGRYRQSLRPCFERAKAIPIRSQSTDPSLPVRSDRFYILARLARISFETHRD